MARIVGAPRASALARLRADPARRAALRDVALAFGSSRLIVLLAGVGTVLIFGYGPLRGAFNPPGVTGGFGPVGNALAAPVARWDSAWYLVIAHYGYKPALGHLTASRTAFFPLYPLGIKALAWLGSPPIVAGVVISLLAFAAALYGIHRLTTLELGAGAGDAARLAVLATAFAPMAFFFSAVYSESLYLALSVGLFWAARSGRWAWVGVLGALAAATRSTGVVLIVPALIIYLYGPREDRPVDIPRAVGRRLLPRYRPRAGIWWLLLIPAGAAMFALGLALAGGEALAPFHAQGIWGRHFAGPYVALWDGLRAAFEGARQLLSFQRAHLYFPAATGSPTVAAGHNLIQFAFLIAALPALVRCIAAASARLRHLRARRARPAALRARRRAAPDVAPPLPARALPALDRHRRLACRASPCAAGAAAPLGRADGPLPRAVLDVALGRMTDPAEHQPAAPEGSPPSGALPEGELPETLEGDTTRSPDTSWRPWTAPLALVAGVVLATVAALVVDLPALALGVHISNEHTPGGLVIADTFVQDVAFVVAAVYCAKLAGRPVRSWMFGLRRPGAGWGWAALLVFCLIVGFVALDQGWSEILHPTKEKLLETLGTKESKSLLVLSAALTCVIAPIGEEMLFRGYMFTALRNWRGTLPAALIVGLLFGGIHATSAPAADLVPLGALGVGLCLIYRFTGSLYPGIASHALNNSIAFAGLEGWNLGQGVLLIVCALLGVAAIAVACTRVGLIAPSSPAEGSAAGLPRPAA